MSAAGICRSTPRRTCSTSIPMTAAGNRSIRKIPRASRPRPGACRTPAWHPGRGPTSSSISASARIFWKTCGIPWPWCASSRASPNRAISNAVARARIFAKGRWAGLAARVGPPARGRVLPSPLVRRGRGQPSALPRQDERDPARPELLHHARRARPQDARGGKRPRHLLGGRDHRRGDDRHRDGRRAEGNLRAFRRETLARLR